MLNVLKALVAGALAVVMPRARLALRVAALEQQLGTFKARRVKPKIGFFDRAFWVLLYRRFGGWKRTLIFVKPETVIGWHKRGYQLLWRWRSRPGRPPVIAEHISMMCRMSVDNPGWGAKRIVAELRKLNVEVSVETVRKYIERLGPPSKPRCEASQSWQTFLKNHSGELLACDFLTQHTVGFGVLYVFVVMHVGSRKVLWTNVTSNPSLLWVKHQLREVCSFEHPYRYLIHDNDGIFGQFGRDRRRMLGVRCQLDHWLRHAMGVKGIPTPYHAPNANAFVERFNRTLREEALNHFVFFGENHLRKVGREYVAFYNRARPSQGIGKIPDPDPELLNAPKDGKVVALPVLGGVQHDYRRAA
jgi:transposase InsO family protein